MKVILLLALALVTMVNFTSHAANAKELKEKTSALQNANGLSVSLIARKRRYKRSDQLKLDVMLTNSGKEAVYIFGTLDWGQSASFVLRVRALLEKKYNQWASSMILPFHPQTTGAPS